MIGFKNFLKNYWPLIINLIIFYIIIYVKYTQIVVLNDGFFVYALDDVYIHMATAKNLVLHGVWGVSASAFTSSTSSIFYPLLIAFFYQIFGINEWVPLWLNIFAATGFLIYMSHLLLTNNITKFFNFFVLLLINLGSSLIVLVFSGLEHIFFMLFAIPFLFVISKKVLDADNDAMRIKDLLKNKQTLIILTLGVGMSGFRYESLFILFIIGIILLYHKKYQFLILLIVICPIPIIIYGIISFFKGWALVPNSIIVKSMLKASATGIQFLSFDYVYTFVNNIPFFISFLALFLVFLIDIRAKEKSNEYINYLTFITIFVTIAQFIFAKVGTLLDHSLRYESYLYVLFILIFSLRFKKIVDLILRSTRLKSKDMISKIKVVSLILIIIGTLPSITRIRYSNKVNPKYDHSTYAIHYNMGRFFHQYYEQQVILVHDIGCISYMGDYDYIDLAQLANFETKENYLDDGNYSKYLTQRNARVAAIFYHLYAAFWVPSSWIRVATWNISTNIEDYPVLYFFAANETEAIYLRDSLIKFTPNIPDVVDQHFYFL